MPGSRTIDFHLKKDEMHNKLIRRELSHIKTIVIKIGSRIITGSGNEKRIPKLIEDISQFRSENIRVVIVSSGAIAGGMAALSLKKRPDSIPLQQACASIGQHRLMQLYDRNFIKYGIPIGQVLLTWDDLRNKKRYLNLRNTLFQLLDCNAIPIVNENDSVGVEEIQFGNNDMLGAQVALLISADLFVNLTDVGGLFDRNPQTDSMAQHIPIVTNVTSSLRDMVDEKKSEISVGGMSTKLKAAEIVTRAGIYCLIGNGFEKRLSDVLLDPKSATLFIPTTGRMSARHRWIAFTGQVCGKITVDDGAGNAILKKGKSLLPAGIIKVEGSFKAGNKVEIRLSSSEAVAYGLVNYGSDEIKTIMKCKTSEIITKLGNKRFDEVIHRNNMVVLQHQIDES